MTAPLPVEKPDGVERGSTEFVIGVNNTALRFDFDSHGATDRDIICALSRAVGGREVPAAVHLILERSADAEIARIERGSSSQ